MTYAARVEGIERVVAEHVARVVHLFVTREKDEHVTRRLPLGDLDHRLDAAFHVVGHRI